MPNQYTGGRNLKWFYAAIKAHDSDECLLWPFGTSNGYGMVRVDGKYFSVHRLAFKYLHGRLPVPEGCHSCDVHACFNPRHIFEGSQADNVHDCIAKKRMPRGETSWNVKLTDDLVRQIRAEYIPNDRRFSQKALAIKHNVTQATIWGILTGRKWKHVE